MLKTLINRIKLYLDPPKAGDVYYGNASYFLVGRPVEYVLFGLKNKSGITEWEPIVNDFSFHFVIESIVQDEYYKCNASVLCNFVQTPFLMQRKNRCQPKKIDKRLFKSLIYNGILTKGKL